MRHETQPQTPDSSSLTWEETERRLYKRMQKKITVKPPPTQIIMERTFNTSCLVLKAIQSLPFSKLTKDLYFLCQTLPSKEISRQFESQMELAGANPERFMFSLHPFYNDFVAKIRRDKRFAELFGFLSTAIRMRIESPALASSNVANAYMNLVLQVSEYLRPDKLNLETFVYGIDTDGELLTGPVPYAFSDILGIQMKREESLGSPKTANILNMYREPLVLSTSSLMKIAEVQRMHVNMTAAMLPFINEFTWDIVPARMYDSNMAPLLELTHGALDLDALYHSLSRRKRTLPANGVLFQADDPTGELQSLLLKEILHDDQIYLLYRADFRVGSVSGYYDTSHPFFYSVFRDATDWESAQKLEELVLPIYASQVLSPVNLAELNSFFLQNGKPLYISPYCRGGRVQDVYHSSLKPKRAYGPRTQGGYQREDRSINGFIRRLPAGQTASPAAIEMAARFGYDLAPDETYVRPFMRTSLVKKSPD